MTVDIAAMVSSGVGVALVGGFFGWLGTRSSSRAKIAAAHAEALAAKSAAESAEHSARMQAEASLVPPLISRIGALETRLDEKSKIIHTHTRFIHECELKHAACQEETRELRKELDRVTRIITPILPPAPDDDQSTAGG